MATRVTHGKGKIYEANSENLISTVSYKIYEELTVEGILEKWRGELTLTDSIRVPNGDKYMIELEDGRKGKCFLNRRVNKAVILVPPRYFYLFHGTGALE